MRTGDDPGAVFDALLARGQIRLHPDAAALQEALAATAAARPPRAVSRVAVVVDTREQAAELNAAIRDRLVAAGRVDDTGAVDHRGGAADRRRRPDRHPPQRPRPRTSPTATPGPSPPSAGTASSLSPRLHRAPVTSPRRVTPTCAGRGCCPPTTSPRTWSWPTPRTAHGVQGDTVTAAHVVVGEHTGAASAYVGMTRGRSANTAHLVAADLDRGAGAVDRRVRPRPRRPRPRPRRRSWPPPRPPATPHPARWSEVLAELHAAWTAEQRCRDRLGRPGAMQRDALRAGRGARRRTTPSDSPGLDADCAAGRAAPPTRPAAGRGQRLRSSPPRPTGSATRCSTGWDDERGDRPAAARVVLDGPGRLRAAPRRAFPRRRAAHRLGRHRWRPHLPDLPADPARLTRTAAAGPMTGRRWRRRWTPPPAAPPNTPTPSTPSSPPPPTPPSAPTAPRDAKLPTAPGTTTTTATAPRAKPTTHSSWPTPNATSPPPASSSPTPGRASPLCRPTPALLAQPPERLQQESQAWRARRDATQRAAQTTLRPTAGADRIVHPPRPDDLRYLTPHRTPGRGIGALNVGSPAPTSRSGGEARRQLSGRPQENSRKTADGLDGPRRTGENRRSRQKLAVGCQQ